MLVILMGCAVTLPALLILVSYLLPDLVADADWLGAVFWLGPSALFASAAISAPFHRPLARQSRTIWAVGAATCAVLWLPAAWFVIVLLFGP